MVLIPVPAFTVIDIPIEAVPSWVWVYLLGWIISGFIESTIEPLCRTTYPKLLGYYEEYYPSFIDWMLALLWPVTLPLSVGTFIMNVKPILAKAEAERLKAKKK